MSKWNHVPACLSICLSLPTPSIRLLGDGENGILMSLFSSTSIRRRPPRDRNRTVNKLISTQFLFCFVFFQKVQTEELQCPEFWYQKLSTGSDRKAAWPVIGDHAGCSMSEVNKMTTNSFNAADLFSLCLSYESLTGQQTGDSSSAS